MQTFHFCHKYYFTSKVIEGKEIFGKLSRSLGGNLFILFAALDDINLESANLFIFTESGKISLILSTYLWPMNTIKITTKTSQFELQVK